MATTTSDETRSKAGAAVSDEAAKLKQDIAELAEAVRGFASEQSEELQGMAKHQLSNMEQQIKRSPTQALMIAGGIGFLAGLIMTSRS
jgi:ElaB/YqjD/DUF883 family membrane-anchored ribosome-binding protein